MVPSIERVARLVRAVRHAGMSTNVDKGCALLARHFGAEADELLCDLLSGRASSLWAEAVPSLLQRLEVLGYSVECLLPNGRILINVGEGPGLMVCVHDAESTAAPLAMHRVMDALSPLFGERGFVLQFEKPPTPDCDLSRLTQAVRLWLATPEANGTERAFYEEGELSLHLFRRPAGASTRSLVPALDTEKRLESLRAAWSARPMERMPEVWLTTGQTVGRNGGAAWLQGMYGMPRSVCADGSGQRLDHYAPDTGGIWSGAESHAVMSVLRWQPVSSSTGLGALVQYDSPRGTPPGAELAMGNIRYTHLSDERDGAAGLAMGWLEAMPSGEGSRG